MYYMDSLYEKFMSTSLDTYMMEASSETYVILSDIYSIVESILSSDNGKKLFSRIVGDFVNNNNSKLVTIGPVYLIPFDYSYKKRFYDLFKISENDILLSINKIITNINKGKDNITDIKLLKQNPIFVLFYCIIRYFTVNKDDKLLNTALTIMALSYYPSIFTKYFKYTPNIGVMQYTIDNLSERFIIKKQKHIFGMLTYSIQSSWKFHENNFKDGSDKKCIQFIQRIRNDQNSLMKGIADKYYDNHKKGLSIYTTTDSFEDNPVIDTENDTNKVELITNKVVTKIVINGTDIKICDFASNATGVSKLDLRNYIGRIIVDENAESMKSFVESLLFLYLYDEKHQFQEINSKQFISFALSLFKKTNSINKNINNIKSKLDEWGNMSGIYVKFTRLATRIDYTRAILLYFILSIQKYN